MAGDIKKTLKFLKYTPKKGLSNTSLHNPITMLNLYNENLYKLNPISLWFLYLSWGSY